MEIFKKNLSLEIIVSALFTITICLFGPLEILMSQSIEFWFSVSDVLPMILGITISVFAVLMLILLIMSKINEKVLRIAISIIAALGFCAYIQGNWTFVNYGSMDGTAIDWRNYTTWALINTVIWFVLAIAVFYIINIKKMEFICKYLFAIVIGIELITLGTLAVGSIGKESNGDFSLDGIGEFKLSANKNNIIVLVADGFDGSDFLPVLEEEPSFREYFDGFTFYEDTCGTSLYSEESIITLLTGNQFEVGPTFDENVKAAYENTDLYDVLKTKDFETYIYCEEKVVSPDISAQIANFNADRSTIGSIKDASGGIYKMVAFRYMPHLLKKYFWYSTMDFSSFKGGDSKLYYNYDVYDYLEEHGVQTSKTNNNIYQFFWIQGPHEPANTDRYCQKAENTVQMDSEGYAKSQFEQTIGVVRLFTKLIESLKEADVYDNTTIILTADHGWDIRPNPLLLIKPANSSGSLTISDVPVSMIEDYLPTLEYFITGEDNGKTIYSLKEGQIRDRLIYVYDINKGDRTYNNRETMILPQGEFDKNVRLGKNLSPANIGSIAQSGFSSFEMTHIWTDGYEAQMKINIKENFNNIRWDSKFVTHNGEQPVEVYVNDSLIDKFTANGHETRSVIIPGNLIPDGVLTIKLLLPNAIAPCEVDPNASDSRKLALSFLEMKFSDTDEEESKFSDTDLENTEEMISESLDYDLGTELYFDSERHSASKYCISGFSGEETNGAWTDNTESKMEFVLKDYANTDLELKINYLTFNGQQNVTVFANGEKLEEFIAVEDGTKTITIPASCIKDNKLELTFELPDAVSPKELGQGEDSRTLALYFESLSIS